MNWAINIDEIRSKLMVVKKPKHPEPKRFEQMRGLQIEPTNIRIRGELLKDDLVKHVSKTVDREKIYQYAYMQDRSCHRLVMDMAQELKDEARETMTESLVRKGIQEGIRLI